MMDGIGGGFMWIVWIFGVVIIGLIIWAIIFVVNKSSNSQSLPSSETPLEILKRRYAKGRLRMKNSMKRKETYRINCNI